MGNNASCQDFHHCEKKANGDGRPPALVQGMAFDEHYIEEVCSSRTPELSDEADENNSMERRLRFQLPPAAPFGLQLAEAICQTPGSASSSVLVVQHVTECSSLRETYDGLPGIHPGDAVIEANGRRGTAREVRDALQQAIASIGTRDINVVVRRRPATFDVEIPVDASCPRKLGFAAIIDKTNPGSVLVTSVRTEGLVPAWNAVHGLSQICAGDLITEVNGISCDSVAMCKEMQSDRPLTKLQFRIAAKEVSYQKTRQSKDPRLFSVRALIEPVQFGLPVRHGANDARRCADLERWQAELEFKSEKLRREVERHFENSQVGVEPSFEHKPPLPMMSPCKQVDTIGCDDDQASDVSTAYSASGACTPTIEHVSTSNTSLDSRKSHELFVLL